MQGCTYAKPKACEMALSESSFKMWGTHTCEQMQNNWKVRRKLILMYIYLGMPLAHVSVGKPLCQRDTITVAVSLFHIYLPLRPRCVPQVCSTTTDPNHAYVKKNCPCTCSKYPGPQTTTPVPPVMALSTGHNSGPAIAPCPARLAALLLPYWWWRWWWW